MIREFTGALGNEACHSMFKKQVREGSSIYVFAIIRLVSKPGFFDP